MVNKFKKLGYLLLLLMLFIPTTVALAEEVETDHEQFEVSCQEVEGDVLLDAESSSKCAVRMQITNNKTDFEGTVKIVRYEGVTPDQVDAFGQTMQIQSGETKTIYFAIPNITVGDSAYQIPLRIDFLDEDGKLLCRKMTDLQVNPSVGYTVAAGVYTDDLQKLNVIDNAGFKYETTAMSANVTMKSRQYTEEELTHIEQLNVNLLVLDKNVSEDVWGIVSQWLIKGGHLMIKESVYQQLIHQTLDEKHMTSYGNGQIFVYDTDDWNDAFFLSSFKNLFGDAGIKMLINGDYTNYYWNTSSLLQYDLLSRLPKISIYLLILLIYLLCMGPVIYLYLKKKDKREYMWLLIPCTAILFSVVVYQAGSSTRYTEPFVRFYSNVDLTDEARIENTKILLTSPDKGSSVMRVEGNTDVQLLSDDYYMEYTDDANEKLAQIKKKLADAEYDVAISVSDDRTDILFKSGSTFEEKMLSSKRILKAGDTIETHLAYYQGALSGTVTNQTQWDLHKVFVIHQGLLFQIGDLLAGETKTVDDLSQVQILKNQNVTMDTWQMANEGNTAAASSIMTTMVNNLSPFLSEDEDVVGGFTLDYDIGVQANSQISSVYGMALIKEKMNVADSGSGWTSQVFIAPEEPENEEDQYQYDTDSYLIYGESVNNVQYKLMSMTGKFYLKWLNVDPDVSLMFYNLSTGNYDTVMVDSSLMDSETLRPYIAKDGTIQVRIQVSHNENNHYMPILTLSGGEKND